MRWLVVSPYLPHSRITHGGGNAVFQLCRALASVHETTLLCFRRHGEAGLEQGLEVLGVDVRCVDLPSERDRGLARMRLVTDRTTCLLRSWWRHRPLMVEKYRRRAMRDLLLRTVAELEPDVVQVEYAFMGPYALDVRRGATAELRPSGRRPRPHVLLNTHELGTLARLRRTAAPGSHWSRVRQGAVLTSWATYERQLVDWADTVACVTEQDRSLLHALSGAPNLRTVPLGVDPGALPRVAHDAAGAPRLLFVGSFGHPPNRDAARLLVEELMPRLLRARSDLVLDLVGADPPAWLRDRAAASGHVIRVHGFVESLDALFGAASLFVAPLFSGGGIKIKILEAMGRGAAVVSTPIGAEGIDEAGESMVIGRDVEDLANQILRLLNDVAARRRLGERARRTVEERFSWPAIVRRLTDEVDSGA